MTVRFSSWSWSRARRSPATAMITGSTSDSAWPYLCKSARACSTRTRRGIIHRDLKPSNVLVTEYDARPVSKIIDFGVAKAIHRELAQTEVGMLLGTPEYMSPEQADLTSCD